MVFQESRIHALRFGSLLLYPDRSVDERLAEDGFLQQHVWEGGVTRNVKRSSTFLILLYHFSSWKYSSDKQEHNGNLDAEYSSQGLFLSECVQYKTYQQALELHGYTPKLDSCKLYVSIHSYRLQLSVYVL